ncbi:MAG: enoyl-CoA hydratase/isomerase family protein [Actinomycetes bacterium]
MSASKIELVVDSGFAWITLRGIDTKNSLDEESVVQMLTVCDKIDSDPTIGVAVVSGEGNAFCSGAHTSVLAGLRGRPDAEVRAGLGRIYEAFTRVRDLKVPTVAMINGAAVGAGVNLAMVCDIRVADKNAVIASGFARLGIHPGGGHMNLIARATSESVASALGVFAQKIDGVRAQEIGLVWAAVESDQLKPTVVGMGQHLASDPALARELVQTLRETADPSVAWINALEIERERQMWTFTRSQTGD